MKSFFGKLLGSLLALPILFLEWGWEPLAALVAKLKKLPCWAALEERVKGLPRWGALLILLAPGVLLFPLKMYALYLLHAGHQVGSLAILLGAKVLGTAIFARLFQLVLPALMTYSWFAYAYPIWKRWKDTCYMYIRASAVWRFARRLKALAKLMREGIKPLLKWYKI